MTRHARPHRPTRIIPNIRPAALLLAASLAAVPAAAQEARKIFISVDMGGIGGIGTPQMSGSNGKDHGLGRELATEEVNAVVTAILERGTPRSW